MKKDSILNPSLKTVVEGNLFALLNTSHALKFLTLPATYALLSYLDTSDVWYTRLKIFNGIKHKFIEETFELFLVEVYLNLNLKSEAEKEFKKVKFESLKPYLYTDIMLISVLLEDLTPFKKFLKENLKKIKELNSIREMIFALLYGFAKTFDEDLRDTMEYLLNRLREKDVVLYYQTLLDTCYRLSHDTLITSGDKKSVLLVYSLLTENKKLIEDIIKKRKRQGLDYAFILSTFEAILLQNNLKNEVLKIDEQLTVITKKWQTDKEMETILNTIDLLSKILANEEESKVEIALDSLLDAIESASRKFMDLFQSAHEEKTKPTEKALLVWYYNIVFGITTTLFFIDKYKKGIEKYLFRTFRLVDYIALPNTALNLLKEIMLFAKLRSLIPQVEMSHIFEKYLSLSLGSSYYIKIKHATKNMEESTVRGTSFAISQFSILPEFLPHITFTLMDLQQKFPNYALELANNGIRTILDGLRSLKLGKDLLMKPPFII